MVLFCCRKSVLQDKMDSRNVGELQKSATASDGDYVNMKVDEVKIEPELIEPVNIPVTKASEKKKFICNLCGKGFQRNDHLVQHREFVHEGIKRHGCPLCDKFFSRKENVATHVRMVHEKRKDFQCEICGKYLTSKFSLDNHRRTHTGERPFVCDICSASFTDPSALIGHKKIHSDSPKIMIKCHFCGSEFSKKWNLDIHIQNKHSGQEQLPSSAYSEETKAAAVSMADKIGMIKVAETLNVKVSAIRSWKASAKTEKTICCNLCGKVFMYQSQLKKHMDCAHREGGGDPSKNFQNRQMTPEFKKEVADFAKVRSYKEAAGHFSISEGTVRRWVAFYHHTVNCEDCGAVFAYEKELKKHQMMKHSEKYRYSTYDVPQPQKKTYELEQRKEKLEELYEKKVQEEIAVQNEIEANTKVVLAAKCLEVVCNEQSTACTDEQKEHEQEVKDEDGKEAFFLEAREGCSDDNEEYTEDGDRASDNSEDVDEQMIEDDGLKAELDLDIKVEVKCEVDENDTNEEVDVKQENTVKGEELQTPRIIKRKKEKKQMKTKTSEYLRKTGKTELKCEYCEKTFDCIYYLNRHIVCHTQEEKFQCDQCEKKFRHRASLLKHQKCMHNGIVYTCHICGKVYNHSHGLTEHINVKHLNMDHKYGGIRRKYSELEKNEMCDDCGMSFVSKSDLKRHQITRHTKDFPFKCENCGMGFLNCKKSNYEIHVAKCGKLYTCDECGKVFNKKSNFQVHMKRHSQIKDFSCMICGKAFYAKRALVDHTEKNHPECMSQFEVEQCDICPETFTTKAKMWLHKIDCHGFDFPYRCTKCNEGFVRMDLKKGHQRVCDGEIKANGFNWTKEYKTEQKISVSEHHLFGNIPIIPPHHSIH